MDTMSLVGRTKNEVYKGHDRSSLVCTPEEILKVSRCQDSGLNNQPKNWGELDERLKRGEKFYGFVSPDNPGEQITFLANPKSNEFVKYDPKSDFYAVGCNPSKIPGLRDNPGQRTEIVFCIPTGHGKNKSFDGPPVKIFSLDDLS
jgi:hypothetical protein